MKLNLIDKNALIRTMRDGLTPLPDKDYDRAKNKIINDLIEVVRGYPEANTSNYEMVLESREYYKEQCKSYEKTIVRLCKTISQMWDDRDDEKGEWE